MSERGPGERGRRDDGDDGPVLPDQTSDDTDVGWGEPEDDLDDDERLLRERPPHW